MFAPQGYISLDEVFERLADEADKWRLSTPNPDDPKPGGEHREGLLFPVDENYERSLAYCHWLFQCFLNRHENELYAVLSNGQTVKLSLSIVRRFKIYDGCFLDENMGWKSIIEHVEDSFTFISSCGYVVSIKQARKWVDPSEIGEIIETLKMIDSCPVCWKLPSDIFSIDWLKVCGVNEELSVLEQSVSLSSIKRRILEQKKENHLLTRDEIKELVAPTVSFRKYKFAWAMAVQESRTRKTGQEIEIAYRNAFLIVPSILHFPE